MKKKASVSMGLVGVLALASACNQGQGTGSNQAGNTNLFGKAKTIAELRDELKTQKEKVKNLKEKLKKEQAEEFACASINEANKAACTRSCWWNDSSKECAEGKAVGDCDTTDMKACGRSDQCAVDERYQDQGGKCYNIAYTTHCNSLAASGKTACEATLNGQQRCDYQAAAAGGCAPVKPSGDQICEAAMQHIIDTRDQLGLTKLTGQQQAGACINIFASEKNPFFTGAPCEQPAPSTTAADCKALDDADFFTDGAGGDAIAAYCTALESFGACGATFLSMSEHSIPVAGYRICKKIPSVTGASCTAR